MNTRRLVSILFFLLAISAPKPSPAANPEKSNEVLKAIVQIKAENGEVYNAGQEAAFDPATGRILVVTNLIGAKYDRDGVGIVLSPVGLFVTNLHTVHDAARVTATLYDGTGFETQIIHKAPEADLVILRVKSPAALSSLHMGNSDAVKENDWVTVWHRTTKSSDQAAKGRVTGIRQRESFDATNNPDQVKYDVIQIDLDAELTEGDSGSPVFNQKGEFIGIVAAGHLFSKNPVYAVPSNLIKETYLNFLNPGAKRGQT